MFGWKNLVELSIVQAESRKRLLYRPNDKKSTYYIFLPRALDNPALYYYNNIEVGYRFCTNFLSYAIITFFICQHAPS